MQDVLVPHNEVIKRPSFVPEVNPDTRAREESSRIEKNPFFEKARTSTPATPPAPRKSNARFWVWIIAIAALLGAVFAVMTYFSSATIEVTPFTQSVKLENEFTATKEAAEDGLIFQFLSLTEEKSAEVPATIEKKIQKKASGKVIIYNAYSGDNQRLIKNTRLEDDKTHKIYRIDDSVVVPGAKMVAGKVAEPGSVEAVIYADAAGDGYNIGLADFTIPGFKGDPRYSKFTARSKPDSPIGGGFSGTVKVPTDEIIAEAQKNLREDLKQTAVEKARGQVPESVSFFPGSMVLKFEDVPQDLSKDEATTVTVRATVSVFFFDTELLTQKIAHAGLKDYKGAPLELSNLAALAFTFLDPVDNVVLADIAQVRFRIDGEASFIGRIDKEKLAAEVAGKNKKDFPTIITSQDNIKSASAVVRPVWKTVFPVDPAKISVDILTQ